ncbi:DNA-directed RNA polymerase subunit alpha [Spiroplasma endosymbiont of 'Nebria riversi']|uniref:DNA-directed RNA polymerase subunit alpha n=1 Tax=Spiroplasma endosymbiont of 'Nebria riversi' TaxID=2792084 RepID=UPI001C04C0B4|nr:DNA-directed RNA polymerase subunit alpha [Spiroplasma endosymbiont of 'Nebria riversi']
MKQFVRPNFKLQAESTSKNFGCFIVEPLERGFGNTIGNALRRTLLAATPGASIYGVDIKGASHEFSTIKGIVENVAQIILNLKGIILKIDSTVFKEEESVSLKVDAGAGEVLASMIVCPLGIEILNGDYLIATVAKGGKLEMTMYAQNSRGYKSFDDNKRLITNIGIIPMDSNYSPIVNVKYSVEPTKVGKTADLEQLVLELTTDGSVTSVEAIAIAAKILIAHLEYFVSLSEQAQSLEIISISEKQETDELEKPIEELDLTVRSYNCLKRAEIVMIGDLTDKTENDILATKNLGRKSFNEIKEKLLALGLTFKRE